MPKLGESVTEGTIARWLKAEGDRVEQYDALAEVVTDKVTAEIPADVAGILQSIVVGENETVAVGTLLAVIAADGEDGEGAKSGGARVDAAAEERTTGAGVSASGTTGGSPDGTAGGSAASASGASGMRGVSGAASAGAPGGAMGRHSPVVSRLAAEHGVNLAQISGSGLGGRITRKDVLRHIEQASHKPDAQRSAATPAVGGGARADAASQSDARLTGAAAKDAHTASTSAEATSKDGSRDESVAVSPMRRIIAKRMVQSKREAPHAWMMVEVDVTELHRLRERERAAFKAREGVDLTYFPFFLKAVADGLRQHPMLNSAWAEDRIVLKGDIHLSIAVATDDALAVPVIHHADRLSIAGLALATNDLARRARAGKLVMADVEGGTFTVNNTGAFRSVLSQPIINAPQAAILSVESIVKRPVVWTDDSIAIRHMVNLCLSMDHRVLDGLAVGRFMQAVKERLEAIGTQTRLY